MRSIDHLPLKSVSEIFVDAASEFVEKAGFDIGTEDAKRLRAEVIRHYEIKLREEHQRSLFSGPAKTDREVAEEKIKEVNAYMAGMLGMYRDAG